MRALLVSLWCCRRVSPLSPRLCSAYPHLESFFARELRDGARPVDPEAHLLAPCDGKVLVCGRVVGDRVEEIKGISYSVSHFLGAAPTPLVRALKNPAETQQQQQQQQQQQPRALFSAVIYLAPGDYHRFHSPAAWAVSARRHISGACR